jgi:tripartite-type tricarboxylate transporter receptor subunit TctC
MKNFQKFIIGLFCLVSSAAFAQFPDRQITMVIPYAPAGSTDVLGRILAQVMSKNLGQTVLVDNTAGAGGTIGAGRVARSKPDGYTILFHNMAQSSACLLYTSDAADEC